MKVSRIVLGLFVLIAASAAQAQQTFTQTVTAQNKSCNSTCSVIDLPQLNNNPNAILFMTPVVQHGVPQNLHPIAAYYMYMNKWSVFNLDGASITEGAQFTVEYYGPSDGGKSFSYQVPSRSRQSDPAYIDYTEINNSPNVQIKIFPSSSQGALFNHKDAKVEYSAATSKWFIANVDGTPVPAGVFYNVAYSPGASFNNANANRTLNTTPKTVATPSSSQGGNCNCPIPTSLPPDGNAAGDLSGTYPAPTVIGLQGKPISAAAPAIGQVLKWNGTEWKPDNESGGVGGPPQSIQSLQTFFKIGSTTTPQLSPNYITLSDLTHQIIIARKSRFVIAATIRVENTDSAIGFNSNKIRLEVFINGVSKMFVVAALEAGAFNMETVGPFMIDEEAGTYNIEFRVVRVSGILASANTFARSNQSSVIVISSDTTNHIF